VREWAARVQNKPKARTNGTALPVVKAPEGADLEERLTAAIYGKKPWCCVLVAHTHRETARVGVNGP